MHVHRADRRRPVVAPALPSDRPAEARSGARPGSHPWQAGGARASRPWESARGRSPGSAVGAAYRPPFPNLRGSGARRSRPCGERPSRAAATGRPPRVRSGRFAPAITSQGPGLGAWDAELEPEPHQGIAVVRRCVVAGCRRHDASTSEYSLVCSKRSRRVPGTRMPCRICSESATRARRLRERKRLLTCRICSENATTLRNRALTVQ